MLSFEALQVLDEIDKQGSFSAAANSLDRAPSSLSYQVQKLEQDLDVVIFDRSGHRAVFTDAGKLLLTRGRALLHSADKLVAETKSFAHGWERELRIAYDGALRTPVLFGLADKLNQQKQIDIHLKEANAQGGWRELLEGRADILITPERQPMLQEIKTQELGFSENIWVASTFHSIHKHAHSFEPKLRSQHRLILVDTMRKLKVKGQYDDLLEGQPFWALSSMQEKYQAIIEGHGIGILPKSWVKDGIACGKLKSIAGSPSVKLCWIMAWKRNRMANGKSWIISRLPSMLAQLDPTITK